MSLLISYDLCPYQNVYFFDQKAGPVWHVDHATKCPATHKDQDLLNWHAKLQDPDWMSCNPRTWSHLDRAPHVPAAINAQFLSDLCVNPEQLGKVAAALQTLRPVKGDFMSYLSQKELPPGRATVLQFASRDTGTNIIWIKDLVARRQCILNYKGGAGVTIGLVMLAFKRWYLLTKLPKKPRLDLRKQLTAMYQKWTGSDKFLQYCGQPACTHVCKHGSPQDRSEGRKHVRYPTYNECAVCIKQPAGVTTKCPRFIIYLLTADSPQIVRAQSANHNAKWIKFFPSLTLCRHSRKNTCRSREAKACTCAVCT